MTLPVSAFIANHIGLYNYHIFFLFCTVSTPLSILYCYLTTLCNIFLYDTTQRLYLTQLLILVHAIIMSIFINVLWITHMYLISYNVTTKEYHKYSMSPIISKLTSD